MRTLRHTWPDVEVHAGVRSLEQAPPGSAIVLAPGAEDAGWLNLRREPFAERKLKVVLWCEEATTVALARNAIDFFDWISHRQECPPGLAPFAVHGIRAAFKAEWPVLWTGSDRLGNVEEVIRNAMPWEEPPFMLASSAPYEDLVAGMQERRIVVVRVTSARELQRVRWARAEASRASRVVLVAPGLECPGFWPVHDRGEDLAQARARLAKAGARAPGRLAALLDLEPEAIDLATTLLETGVTPEEIERAVTGTMDPGARLSLWTEKQGVLPLSERYFLDVLPPVLRGIAGKPAARAAFEGWRRRAPDDWKSGVPAKRDVGVWAAHSRASAKEGLSLERLFWPWILEGVLRLQPSGAAHWLVCSAIAASLGDKEVATEWIDRALAGWTERKASAEKGELLRGNDMLAGTLLEWIHVAANELSAYFLLVAFQKATETLDRKLERYLARLKLLRGLWLALAPIMLVAGVFLMLDRALLWPLIAGALLFVLGSLVAAMWIRSRAEEVEESRSWTSRMGAFFSKQADLEGATISRLARVHRLVASEAFEEAEGLARETVQKASKELGEHHPQHERAIRWLAAILVEQGRPGEALTLIEPHVAAGEADLSTIALRILLETGRAGEAVEALWWLVNGEGAPVASGPRPAPFGPATAPGEAPLLAALLRRPAGWLRDRSEAHLVLVDALLKQGRYPEAIGVANSAVRTFTEQGSPSVRALRERLTDLQRRLGPSA